MRPISGSFDPYAHRGYPVRRPATAGVPAVRVDSRAVGDASVAMDVEISIRMFADGGSISVRRHSVADADGTRRTVGIDALIR